MVRAYRDGRRVAFEAPAADEVTGGRGPRGGSVGRPVHRIYLHFAWWTLHRLPLLSERQAYALEGELVALCRRLNVEPLAISVRPDRVHLLLRLKPVLAASEVARRLKEGTADMLLRREAPVRWGRGYAVESVAPDEVLALSRRIVRPR